MAIEYIEVENVVATTEVVVSDGTVIEIFGGIQGERGQDGSAGSLPPGGTVGQTLVKQSSTDSDAVWSTLNKSSVGLPLVDNTSDANKPVSGPQQAALDGKANTVHSHAISNVTGLQDALDSKASTSHLHGISSVVGLQDALDAKANAAHSHAISDVSGLQTALDGKAASSHNHASTDISDSTATGRSLITAASSTAARNAIGAGIGNMVSTDVAQVVRMTRAAFDALATKDANTMYLIRG